MPSSKKRRTRSERMGAMHALAAQRTSAATARATARHMSNAKWRELFRLLRKHGVVTLHWKYVQSDRVFTAPPPKDGEILDAGLADVLPDPYGLFRDIDWIELPRSEQEKIPGDVVGRFVTTESDTGVRVHAYSW